MMNINNKYKTVMCKHFQNGQCHLGSKCHFAHGPEELRNANDPVGAYGQMPVGNEPKPFQGASSRPGPATPSNYKTIKCRFFEQGHCKYDSKCTFAHGDQDMRLQNSPMPPHGGSNKQSSHNTASSSYNQAANVQTQIAQQQILFLISNLEKHHDGNTEFSATLKKATDINNTGDVQNAASLVYSIINRTNKTDEDANFYEVLQQNLQTYSTYLYQQMQNPYPQASPTSMYGYNSQPSGHSGHAGSMPQSQSQSQSQQYTGQYNPQYSQHQQSQNQYSNPNHGQNYDSGNASMSGITNMMGGMHLSNNYSQGQPYNSQPRYQSNQENYA